MSQTLRSTRLTLTDALDTFEDALLDIRKACVENALAISRENKPYAKLGEVWNEDTIMQHVRWLIVDERASIYMRVIKRIDTVRAPVRPGSITDADIARAKDFPITELFDGKLFNGGAGRKKGVCPFHNGGREKTPSFYIMADNRFYCFGCNQGGDSIDFVMKRDGIEFIPAVKKLM